MTDQSAPAQPETFRLIYRSHDLIPAEERKAALGQLFTKARSNNKALGISGALLVRDDWFVQTLEGDEGKVRSLFDTIAADPRHDQVAVLSTGTVHERVFQRWSMARVGDDGDADSNLIAHEDGIAKAASRPTTRAQEYVLSVMRDATRDVPAIG